MVPTTPRAATTTSGSATNPADGLASARRHSGARAVYELLRTRIISGELEPGERLTEPVLAQQLGVSRTPVREALRLLYAEALVVELPTGGVRVAPLDAHDLRRVYDVRARLEALLAGDAAERAEPGQLARLERVVDVMDTVREHHDEVLRLGATFHELVEEMADNPWGGALLRQIRGHVDRYRALSTRTAGRPDQAVAEHREIYLAILGGDRGLAEDTMRRHVERGAETAATALAAEALLREGVPVVRGGPDHA
ncbi:GntR family transcriptional regulator [Luteimicrobium subarcticum]|nr:GntR family transcriptional regulator [Luteimicrobium subarcticum]